jgi:FAD/FMN-containing dehydrogenase
LVRSTGETLFCSRESNAELFQATIGGLGLTGFIVSASIRLKKVSGPNFDVEVIPYGSLSEFFAISEDSTDWQATVSWFDCSTRKSGRGSFTRGNHSDDTSSNYRAASLSVPFTPPISLVNKLSLDAFNTAYYVMQKRKAGKFVQNYRDFYYPLDGVGNWNRIYGPKGFYQYQSVVPMENAQEATSEMLSIIQKSGQGSFLAVLKTFGDRLPAGLMSFARAGATLALDFPNRGEKTQTLFAALDRIVLEAGGALNPSKDALMSRELFEAGFPRFAEFKKLCDPSAVSDFSRRVGIR